MVYLISYNILKYIKYECKNVKIVLTSCSTKKQYPSSIFSNEIFNYVFIIYLLQDNIFKSYCHQPIFMVERKKDLNNLIQPNCKIHVHIQELTVLFRTSRLGMVKITIFNSGKDSSHVGSWVLAALPAWPRCRFRDWRDKIALL